MTAHAAPTRLQTLARAVRRPGIAHSMARTAGFNVASVVAAGLGGIVIARALGPTVRGDYAAITAWFGVALPAEARDRLAETPGIEARRHALTQARDLIATWPPLPSTVEDRLIAAALATDQLATARERRRGHRIDQWRYRFA